MHTELRIRADFESERGAQRAHEYTVEIRRAFGAADLLIELDRFWRSSRNLADVKRWIVTLVIEWPERSRSVSLVYSANDSSESAQRDWMREIFTALGQLSHGPYDNRRRAGALAKKSEAR
jgi:hypothetical protein